MPKKGYQFHQEKLLFVNEKPSLGRKIIRGLLKFISSLCIAVVIFGMYWIFFDSPKEKALKRENGEILTQYHLLSKEVERLDNILQGMEQRDDNIYRTVFESEPIANNIRRAGSGGVNKYEHLKHLSDADLVVTTAKKIDELSKAMYIQSKSYDEIELLAKHKIDMLASIPAILPLSFNGENTRVTSGFGNRMHPIYKIVKPHTGMDFSGSVGTPIYATGNGVIEKSVFENGYGRHVVINHGYGYKTLYGHLNNFNVKVGQKVKRGDIIGFMGNTGVSSSTHLHYEVRKNNVAIDPVNFYYSDLTPDEYDALVEAANNTGQSMD